MCRFTEKIAHAVCTGRIRSVCAAGWADMNEDKNHAIMKLAEALSRRAALMEKVQQLKTRLLDCIKVQEGDEPVETPQTVVAELESTLSELQQLIYRINITNSRTVVDGRSITSLLAERDVMTMRTRTLGDALGRLTETEGRYSRNEIKNVRTVDTAEFRRIYDKSASMRREFDLKIQEIGWTTDLIEE